MANELILKTDETPSLINKELVIGALLAPLLISGGLIATAAGAAVGAFIGKKRMEREESLGKIVPDRHTVANKDTLLGGLVGMASGRVVAGGLIAAAIVGSVAMPVAIVGAIAAFLGGGTVGAVIGNKLNERQHAAEYDQAKHQAIVRQAGTSVSPEIAHAVDYALDHQKSWANDVTTRRMLADSQAASR